MSKNDRRIPATVKKYLWKDDGLWAGIIYPTIAWIGYFLVSIGWIKFHSDDNDRHVDSVLITQYVAIAITIGALGYAAFSVWRWFRLMRRGIVVDGEITRISGSWKNALVRLDFAYLVDGKLHSKAKTTATAVAEQTPVGSPVHVLVDPRRPSLALLLDDVFPDSVKGAGEK